MSSGQKPRKQQRSSPSGDAVGTRRLVAIGIGVLIVILLVLGVRGCLSARKERALKDYNRNVTSIVVASDEQVGKPLFEALTGESSPIDRQTQISQLRVQAQEQLKRAKELSTPGEMQGAQRSFLLALQLRHEAVTKIGEKIPTALGSGAGSELAVNQIAGQMQTLLASDVIYSQRVSPLIKESLDAADINGQLIASSRFLPDLGWLEPANVADRLGAAGAKRASKKSGPIAAGTHGHAVINASAGSTPLQGGSVPNRIQAQPGLGLTVKIQNQGENDEFDVKVTVKITGSGKPVSVSKIIDQTAKGTEATVPISLPAKLPIGDPVTIDVEVAGVPGEKNLDNNKQSYTALFIQ